MDYQAENMKLIALFEPCRVTDVRDGMDWLGYHAYGSVHHSIRPLWRTHAVGIARTARYLPYEGPAPLERGAEYTKWASWYYGNVCTDPWSADIQPGDFMCLDICGLDVGLLGSNNTLGGLNRGVRGYLTNGGGIRDTDEVIMQKVPVWSKFISQGMDQARIRYYEKDTPIAIGGVAIYPGDVVVADGDGVIVVPRAAAYDVAKYAWQEMNLDKVGRAQGYATLGWDADDTVSVVAEVK